MPTFAELKLFLNNHIRGLQSSGTHQQVKEHRKPGPSQVKSHHLSSSSSSAPSGSTQSKCAFCPQYHPHFRCLDFLKKTPAERSEMVKINDLCFNCLNSGHKLKDCRSKKTCKVCNKKHHSFLHEDGKQNHQQHHPPPPPPPSEQLETARGNNTMNNHHTQVGTRALLQTAIANTKDIHGNTKVVRVLLDGGSEGTLITESCANRLGLQRRKTNVHVGGVGLSKAGKARGAVYLSLESKYRTYTKLDLEAHVLPDVTDYLPTKRMVVRPWSHLHGMDLADPHWNIPAEVDMLIGMDYYNSILLSARRDGPKQSPTANQTIFGWVLSGPSCVETRLQIHSISLREDHDLIQLEEIMRKFWEVEEPPANRILTKDEKIVEEHFIKTYKRDQTGRFQVRIPFKEEKKKMLGSSRAMAVRRFLSVEKRLRQNPHHRDQYVQFMAEYETLGHMTKCNPNEQGETVRTTHYLPHHHVVNESSSTTKLRMVFDGSARTSTGVSINDAMFIGAKLQDDLYNLLLKFRAGAIVIKSDITKMFRQFYLSETDANYHRIVWRSDPNEPLLDYKLLTITYGTACAPNLSTRCLQQLGKDVAQTYPLASHAILNETYVDDIMASAPSPQTATLLYHELTAAAATAQLTLRKWSTNCPAVLAVIPENERETSIQSLDSDESLKALGVQWCPSKDVFSFKCVNYSGGTLTKRILLSELSKTFDPLGFLSCVTVRAKLLMQELWRLQISWDEEVPEEIASKWNEYQKDMELIPEIKIPRRITTDGAVKYQLHGFADASCVAYGCVIYLRSETANGTITTKFITSKTRVAPLRQITIPRLELMAAVQLAELIDHVKTTLDLNCDVYCWSDSTITLKWIASSPRRWQLFVCNRVSQIQQFTDVECWRHVPGTNNPADLASRGVRVTDIKENQLWFGGPEWLLQKDLPLFPMNALADDVLLEERKQPLKCHPVSFHDSFLERFSTLPKLKYFTAAWLRLRHNAANRLMKRTGLISTSELCEALMYWIKKVQSNEFKEELEALSGNKPIPTRSKLLPLHPFLDQAGILRVGGRLSNSAVPASMKHQIILPPHNHLTTLIVRATHLQHFHSGFQLTLSRVLSQYWIIRGRSLVRGIVRQCTICIVHRKQAATQLMGNLPACRVTPAPPFWNVGTDYAGPFSLKNPIGRAPKVYKGYICLYVCMVTKAIHLEVVEGLTTNAFIECLRRFIARRGKPATIYSDCGSNYIGAEVELKRFLRTPEYQQQYGKAARDNEINFEFLPPSSPHQGGLWEAGVKSVKFHMRRVLGNKILTFNQLSTFLCQVEAILNSRPLHPMSTDPEDLEVLTPGHFLIGRPLTAIPGPDLHDIPTNRLSHYQQLQQQLQNFWRLWSMQYLHTLQQRNKWRTEHENLKPGDLVLIREESDVQNWKKARVILVHPGKDDKVRVVTLQTATGQLKRPIQKLIPLIQE